MGGIVQDQDIEGFYINLDRSTDRRAAVESSIAQLSIGHKIQRFAALEGDDRPAQLTKSQLGCFLSHQAILNDADDTKFTLIFEDDVVFPSMFNDYWEIIWPVLSGIEADVIFLNKIANYGDPKLINNMIKSKRSRGDIYKEGFRSFTLHNCKGFYAAGAAAYVVKPGAQSKLRMLLLEACAAGYSLAVDSVYCNAIYSDRLRSGFVFPYIVGTSLQGKSTIESSRDGPSARLSNEMINLFVAGGNIRHLAGMAKAVLGDDQVDTDAFIAAHIFYSLLS
jgi:GR25 family glycosyltransferase involved in LPS biosynthesis